MPRAACEPSWDRIRDLQESGIRGRALHLTHTSGVQELEIKAVYAGICKLIEEVRSRINVINDDSHKIADHYQNQARMMGNRINGSKILTLLSEGAQKYPSDVPHMDMMICDCPMVGYVNPTKNYSTAYGLQRYPNSVISIGHFRHIEDETLRSYALAVTAAHEIGHLFNLPSRNFNTANELGWHCNGDLGPCLMEQIDMQGRRNTEEQARILAFRAQWLCPDCAEEASVRKVDTEQQGLMW